MAIDGEETQTCCRQAIEMAVGVRHQLIGLLAGGIQTHRMVHRLLLMEGQIAIPPVDRTT